jgi:hypothetical protein
MTTVEENAPKREKKEGTKDEDNCCNECQLNKER